MAKNATLVKKLTVKSIMGINGPEDLEEMLGDKKSLDLCHIYGSASGVKTGTGTYGDWSALLGRFRSVNLLTGEVMESGRCIMPAMGNELVLGKLGSEDNKAVEFAFTIGIKADKKAKNGYQYTVTPLIAASDADPMVKLEAAAGIKTGLLLESKKGEG